MDEISQAQAAAEGLPDHWKDVAALARTAMNSDVVKQAVSTGRYRREVYVGAPEGSVFEYQHVEIHDVLSNAGL